MPESLKAKGDKESLTEENIGERKVRNLQEEAHFAGGEKVLVWFATAARFTKE